MEQRKYQRTPILLPARIIQTEQHSLQGRIINYSQQGLFLDIFDTSTTLPPTKKTASSAGHSDDTNSPNKQSELPPYQPGDELTISFTMPQFNQNKMSNQKEQILASTSHQKPETVELQAKVVRCHQKGLGLQRLPSKPWPYDSLQHAANILQQHLKVMPPLQSQSEPQDPKWHQTILSHLEKWSHGLLIQLEKHFHRLSQEQNGNDNQTGSTQQHTYFDALSDLKNHHQKIQHHCLKQLSTQIQEWLAGNPSALISPHNTCPNTSTLDDWVRVRVAANKLSSNVHRELFKLSGELKKSWNPKKHLNFYNPLSPEYVCTAFKLAITPYRIHGDVQNIVFDVFTEYTEPQLRSLYTHIHDDLLQSTTNPEPQTIKKEPTTPLKDQRPPHSARKITPPVLGEHLEVDHFNPFALLSKAIRVRRPDTEQPLNQNTSTPAQSYLSQTLETLVLKELGNFDGSESHQDVIQYLMDEWQQEHPQQQLPEELQWQLKVIQIFFSQLDLNIKGLVKNATPYAWLKKTELTLIQYCFQYKALLLKNNPIYPYTDIFLKVCKLSRFFNENLTKKVDLILTELICHNTDDQLLEKIIEKFSNLLLIHQQNINNHQQKLINHYKSQIKTEKIVLHILNKSLKNRKTSRGVAQFLTTIWLPHLVQLGSDKGVHSTELKAGFRILKNLILLMPPSKPNSTYTPSSWLKDVKSHIQTVKGNWQTIQPAIKKLMGEYHECIRSRSVNLVENALAFIDPLKLQDSESEDTVHRVCSENELDAWKQIQKFQSQQSFHLESPIYCSIDCSIESLNNSEQHNHQPIDIKFIWSDQALKHFLFVDAIQQTPMAFSRQELIHAIEEKRITRHDHHQQDLQVPSSTLEKTVQHTILGELYLEHFYQCSKEHMMPQSHFQWKATALIHHPCLSPWWHALCIFNTVTAQTQNTRIQKDGLTTENLSNSIRSVFQALSLVNNTSFIGMVHLGEGLYGTLWQKMKSQDLETLINEILTTLKSQHEIQATAGLVYFDDDKEPVQEYLKKARYACMSIDPQKPSYLKVYTPAKFAIERQTQLRESTQEKFTDQLKNNTLLLRGKKLCLSSFKAAPSVIQNPTDKTAEGKTAGDQAPSLALLVQPYLLTPSLPSSSTAPASIKSRGLKAQYSPINQTILRLYTADHPSIKLFCQKILKQLLFVCEQGAALPLFFYLPIELLNYPKGLQILFDQMILNQDTQNNEYPTLVFDAMDLEQVPDEKLSLLESCVQQGFSMALDYQNSAHLSPQLLLRLKIKYLILPEEYFTEDNKNDENSNHHHWKRSLMLCHHLKITCIIPNKAQKDIPTMDNEERPVMDVYWLDHPTMSLTPFLKSNKDHVLNSKTKRLEVENIV